MSKLNIYTVGMNEEFTTTMVKNLCPEFETLTHDQALRICELLAQIHNEQIGEESETVQELRSQVSELSDEIDGLESDVDYYREKAKDLQDKLNKMKGDN